MKKPASRRAVQCPKCNAVYTAPPAISREDGRTFICPDCGTREALQSLGVSSEEQERIIGIIHRCSGDVTVH